MRRFWYALLFAFGLPRPVAHLVLGPAQVRPKLPTPSHEVSMPTDPTQPTVIPADQVATFPILAEDAYGNPTSATLGTVTATTSDAAVVAADIESGSAVLLVTPPTPTNNLGTATVTIASGGLAASRSVKVVPGATAKVALGEPTLAGKVAPAPAPQGN